MAYNIAANLNPIDPVGNFLAARQARQQSDQQNMLFEQRQQDRVAQQQAGAAQAEEAKQKAAYEWGVNAVGVLAPLKDDPVAFGKAKETFLAEAPRYGITLRPDEVTPESVAAIEAQLRVRGGIAQPAAPKPDTREVGGALVRLNPDGTVNELYRAPPKPGEGYTLTPGARRYDASGKLIASVPTAPREQPERYRLLSPQEATAQGLPPGNYQVSPAGQITSVGGTAQDNKPPTAEERRAANFLGRMTRVQNILGQEFSDPEKKKPNPLAAHTPGWLEFQAGISLISRGNTAASLANATLDANQQKFWNLASDFIRAKLRKESGAVIGVDEAEQEFRTYFPIAGDTPDVIAQKAVNRQQAIEGLAVEAGRAAGSVRTAEGPAAPSRPEAPPEAIAYLRQNPQYKAAFKAKYGYVPDGM